MKKSFNRIYSFTRMTFLAASTFIILSVCFGVAANNNHLLYSVEATTTSSLAENTSGNATSSTIATNINATTDFLTYESPILGISIEYPDGWETGLHLLQDIVIVQFINPSDSPLDEEPESVIIITINDLPQNVTTLDQLTSMANMLLNTTLIEYNVTESGAAVLAGNPAHKNVFTFKNVLLDENLNVTLADGKAMTISMINGSTEYSITYSSEASKYDNYLPIVQRMLDSFQISDEAAATAAAIGQRNNNITTSTTAVLDNNNNNNNTNFLIYENSTANIRMQYPANWIAQSTGLERNDIVVFFSPPSSESDTFYEQVIVRSWDANSTTLENYTSTLVDTIRTDSVEFRLLEENETILANNNSAHQVVMFDSSKGNSTLKVLDTWTIANDKIYRITYLALPTTYSNYLPIAQKMIDSFEIMRN